MNDNGLADLIKCPDCTKIYTDPIILNCGITICAAHLKEDTKYKCSNCNQNHFKLENGYPIDYKALKLMEMNENYIKVDKINFGNNNQKAKTILDDLAAIIDQAEPLTKDPLFYIDDFFNKLRNKINLTREQYIQMIEKNFEKVVNQVISFERECRLNVENKNSVLNKSIRQTKNSLIKWNESLRVPDFTKDNYWNELSLDAEKENEKIKYLIKKLKNDLLLNKHCDFIPKMVLEDNNFGDLNNNVKDIIDENRTEGTIRWTINDFIAFKNAQKIHFSKDWCVIKNIPWRISAKIHETKDFDLYLGVYTKPSCDNELLKSNPANAKVSLKITQQNDKIKTKSNSELACEKLFEKKFENNLGLGYPQFILLKEIMKEENGIYNKQNDSITLEANIKILD